MRLVQLIDSENRLIVALVEEPNLIFISNFKSVYDLVIFAMETNSRIKAIVEENLSSISLNYDEIYTNKSIFKITTPIHNPVDQRFCMVSGTGLTHKASAENRQKMHEKLAANEANDSIKMYQIGVDGGKPDLDKVGAQPEWFYKGNGSVLKAHNQALTVPNFGNDGGEEPELAAVYINDKNRKPHRIGFITGNEFSDHVMEKKNYLYLAPSKIRNCSIGPEIVIIDEIDDISGKVEVIRNGESLWSKDIKTGEANMCHSLGNLEYHHFKYENHRIAGDLHIHFLGTGAFSFGAGIQLETGDEMIVKWEDMGRALRNKIVIDSSDEKMFKIENL